MKKLLLVLLCIGTMIGCAVASTPTGVVTVSYAQPVSGTCPNSGTNGATAPLDGSGAYQFAMGSNFPVGSYCIYVHYNGDATHNPSDAPVFTQVVNSAVSDTSTTSSASPNPSTQGSAFNVSGSVASH